MKVADMPVSGNNVKFNRTNLIVRVLESEYGISKTSGNPMITLKVELCDNDILDVSGRKVDVNGLKHTYYIPLIKGNAAKLVDLYNRLQMPKDEIPLDKECTDANHPDPTEFNNLKFMASIGNEEVFATEAPKPARVDPATGAQLPAQKQGDKLIDPNTGKPISRGFQLTGQFTEIWYKVG